MIYTGAICCIAWLLSYLLWTFNVVGQGLNHLPPEYEIAFFLIFYFAINAVIDLAACYFVTRFRVRGHTEPLRYVLLCSALLHVAGGIAYAVNLDYEGAYIVGLWGIAIAQILCFGGPWFHRRFGRHERKRREARHSSGHGIVASGWTNRG